MPVSQFREQERPVYFDIACYSHAQKYTRTAMTWVFLPATIGVTPVLPEWISPYFPTRHKQEYGRILNCPTFSSTSSRRSQKRKTAYWEQFQKILPKCYRPSSSRTVKGLVLLLAVALVAVGTGAVVLFIDMPLPLMGHSVRNHHSADLFVAQLSRSSPPHQRLRTFPLLQEQALKRV